MILLATPLQATSTDARIGPPGFYFHERKFSPVTRKSNPTPSPLGYPALFPLAHTLVDRVNLSGSSRSD